MAEIQQPGPAGLRRAHGDVHAAPLGQAIAIQALPAMNSVQKRRILPLQGAKLSYGIAAVEHAAAALVVLLLVVGLAELPDLLEALLVVRGVAEQGRNGPVLPVDAEEGHREAGAADHLNLHGFAQLFLR
eukprot:scaffold1659_cov255-Pinguiococcus_pyrenoidosus.AAC.16